MIRKATHEDINKINELGSLLYDNFSKTYVIEKYLNNTNYIILVNDEDDINGFLIVYKNLDYYELEIIVISKQERNKGIGTKLLKHFEDAYCRIGDVILLEVSCENEFAIKLYKKFNFETINIRKKYYNGIDAYIMKKVI